MLMIVPACYTEDMKRSLRNFLWLCAAAILVVIFGAIYAVVQQAERSGANFPQVQVAEDVAAALDQGTDPRVITAGKVDMAASLAPFLIIYDRSGKIVSGSGYLSGQIPDAPLGMLQASKGAEYHAITWAPEPTVRIASVTVAANKYYVLSGRNLREVEKNENKTFLLAFCGGAVSWLILGVAFVVMYVPMTRRAKQAQ